MALPINIEELIHGKTVEWARIELKKGWNDVKVMRTMCAFANDLHNWGGGYIVIGIEEEDGQAKLPPNGIRQNEIDSIQKELLQLSHKITPNYFPVVEPYIVENKHILVIWCPAGDNRPYSAPASLDKGAHRNYYVRITSNTVIAHEGSSEHRQLIELAARIPFDDRMNQQATIDDLNLSLIQAHLQDIKSDLFKESHTMSFSDLCRTMLIAKGPEENLLPVNVGLLFFSKNPEKFFARSWIELAWHKDNSGKNFEEIVFKGPIQKQITDVLAFFKLRVLTEQIIKREGKADADRFVNYPYQALEEVIPNAVYHKSYELHSPIEIQIFPNEITILNYPGPMPPVNSGVLNTKKRIIAREYRNRRIGDFLKELHLTEGKGTGFPTIYNAMEANGSPEPIFETDDKTFFMVTLKIHPDMDPGNRVSNGAGNGVKDPYFNTLEDVVAYSNGAGNGAGNGARDEAIKIISSEIHDRVPEMLQIMIEPVKRSELFEKLELSNQTKNRVKYLDPLLNIGWVEKTITSETDPNQKYKITKSGFKLLKLIKS